MTRRIVVVGTGTDVGKTYVACHIVRSLQKQGATVGLKPVESGVETVAADAIALGDAGDRFVPPRYALPAPVSPHLAARLVGEHIDLDAIVSWVQRHEMRHTVVETAGGLMSPLAEGENNLTLAVKLAPDHVVLVACNGLGVLHDVASAVHLLRAHGLARPTVILCDPEALDASSESNLRELRLLDIVQQGCRITRNSTTAGQDICKAMDCS